MLRTFPSLNLAVKQLLRQPHIIHTHTHTHIHTHTHSHIHIHTLIYTHKDGPKSSYEVISAIEDFPTTGSKHSNIH